jgi:hypothetical protein
VIIELKSSAMIVMNNTSMEMEISVMSSLGIKFEQDYSINKKQCVLFMNVTCNKKHIQGINYDAHGTIEPRYKKSCQTRNQEIS